MAFKMWVRGLVALGSGVVVFALLVFILKEPACESPKDCPEDLTRGPLSWVVDWLEPKVSPKTDNIQKTKPIPSETTTAATASEQPKAPTLVDMTVDSLSPTEQYDVVTWNLVGYRSGNVDSVQAENGIKPNHGRLVLGKGGFVTVSGWAGHPAYGMRFRDVLFSLCGKVVGRAAVNGSRPDVAKAVHKNLSNSGWQAKLATDMLPRCEEQVLQVWGVAPIGFNAFPLTGKTKLVLAENERPAVWKFHSQAKLLTPAENGPAVLKSIDVTAAKLRLRKCGDVSCDVVGHIVKGRHQGYVLENVNKWSLLQIGEAVGWAHNDFIQIR